MAKKSNHPKVIASLLQGGYGRVHGKTVGSLVYSMLQEESPPDEMKMMVLVTTSPEQLQPRPSKNLSLGRPTFKELMARLQWTKAKCQVPW